MKKLNLRPVVNLNEQKSEINKNEFTTDELITKEEMSKILGGGDDDDPNTIVIGGPK